MLDLDFSAGFAGALIGMAIGEQLATTAEGKTRAELSQAATPFEELSLSSPELATNYLPYALATVACLVRSGGKLEIATLDYELKRLNLAKPVTSAQWLSLVLPVGLLQVYGQFSRERLQTDCEIVAQAGTADTPTGLDAMTCATGVALAGGLRMLCRQDILIEDLMAVALDFIPPGYLGLPLANCEIRQKLLATQDFIEERQTLVDNVEAGNLEVDFLRVDLNNMERCGTTANPTELLAGAFYAVAACKTSFSQALELAVKAGGAAGLRGAITGGLAGALLGIEAIPVQWRKTLPGTDNLLLAANALHRTALSRELTDYMGAGI